MGVAEGGAAAGADGATAGYQSGFGNQFATEALPGALPVGRNSPQRPPYGLYAEQFSGTAFTAPRHANRRSWLYRIRPAAVHGSFAPLGAGRLSARFDELACPPNPLRWNPPPLPRAPTDFLDGLATLGGNGSPDSHGGCAIHWYVANRSMAERFFYDADGELLIVPQQGALRLATELGVIDVAPQQIAVIPRGLRLRVELSEGSARGYVCENFGAPLKLPDLGPIGANGLANPRDFQTPVAWYEDRDGDFELVAKFAGALWTARIDHSPLDVVAWHGNHAPYRYDLRRFNTHRLGQLRPPGSVHLPGAALGQRYARSRCARLRDLSAALAGDAGHVPAAVVPPQCRQRVHGADRRGVRRQGAGVRAGRRLAAQLHERARAGRGQLREGDARRHLAAGGAHGHHGLHVRDTPAHPPDALRARDAAAAAGLRAGVA